MIIVNGLAIICHPFQDCLRSAVKAVIDYVQSGYRSLTYRPKCDVKRYVNSQSDKGEAAGLVLKSSLPFLKSDECERREGNSPISFCI